MATEANSVLSYADSIAGILDGLLGDMMAGIKHNSTMAGQVATGKTLRSLHYVVEPAMDGSVSGTLFGRAFFGTLETGRGPARRKGTASDRAAWQAQLKEWCRIRGFPAAGLSDAQYERAATFLRWYINKHGDRLYRRGGRKDIFTPEVATFKSRLKEALYTLSNATIEDTMKGALNKVTDTI